MVVKEDVDEGDNNGKKDGGGEKENKCGNKVTEKSDDNYDEAGDDHCKNVESDGDGLRR